jgi:hypothetical protein
LLLNEHLPDEGLLRLKNILSVFRQKPRFGAGSGLLGLDMFANMIKANSSADLRKSEQRRKEKQYLYSMELIPSRMQQCKDASKEE